jgi:predicted neutral ceramidase superfamily lipid hydrolase
MANIHLPTFKRVMNPPYIYGFPMTSIMIMVVPVVISFLTLIFLTMSSNSGVKIILSVIVVLVGNTYLFFWLKKKGKRIIIMYYLKFFQPVRLFSSDKPIIKRVQL